MNKIPFKQDKQQLINKLVSIANQPPNDSLLYEARGIEIALRVEHGIENTFPLLDAEMFAKRLNIDSYLRYLDALIYKDENGTQRQNEVAAQVGVVASAVKQIAKGVLTEDKKVIKIFITSELAQLRHDLGSEKGIGNHIVEKYLGEGGGFNLGVINSALANLKTSGNYALDLGKRHPEFRNKNQERNGEEVS